MLLQISIYISNNSKKDEVACALEHVAIVAKGVIEEKGLAFFDSGCLQEIYPKFTPNCFKSSFLKIDFNI